MNLSGSVGAKLQHTRRKQSISFSHNRPEFQTSLSQRPALRNGGSATPVTPTRQVSFQKNMIDGFPDVEIVQEEIFGPVLPVLTFKTLDEAFDLACDTKFGLTSSIYTTNVDIAERAKNELRFGETYVNRENFEAIQGFHAGMRQSGIGGADGKHGLEEYLASHVVYVRRDPNAGN